MNVYVIQVETGSESKFLRNFRQTDGTNVPQPPALFFPKRKMIVRKQKQYTEKIYPVFPGYVFLQSPEITPELIRVMRTVPGFGRFLPENKKPENLAGRDMELIRHFMSFGETADLSKVFFDEQDRIRVVAGPLKGLEGAIVKVDRRKKRAKIRLDFSGDSFTVDLGFEVITK
ncbi:MAG: antiterminator LoaP [Spirochaetes bacterium]|uniref:Antiterminator LoaP n=1 Tax=Candidatus Avitreponema avistercoris TaxID=2840705 RepID=A0A9D9HHS1_9SPIR|nr:antiterminator LoaP [Candidatus Avitreponema avistercoris]